MAAMKREGEPEFSSWPDDHQLQMSKGDKLSLQNKRYLDYDYCNSSAVTELLVHKGTDTSRF